MPAVKSKLTAWWLVWGTYILVEGALARAGGTCKRTESDVWGEGFFLFRSLPIGFDVSSKFKSAEV